MYWRPSLSCAALLIGLIATTASLSVVASEKPKTRRDPAGASVLMGKFRSLFDAWDLNKDGFLDKEELAKAFRGSNAKPYVKSPGTIESVRAIARKFPDHDFLVQLDQDGDGKISRTEFMDWARSYVKDMNKVHDGQQSVSQKEKRLKDTLPADEKKKLTEELKQERKALTDMQKQMKHLQTIERHIQHIK